MHTTNLSTISTCMILITNYNLEFEQLPLKFLPNLKNPFTKISSKNLQDTCPISATSDLHQYRRSSPPPLWVVLSPNSTCSKDYRSFSPSVLAAPLVDRLPLFSIWFYNCRSLFSHALAISLYSLPPYAIHTLVCVFFFFLASVHTDKVKDIAHCIFLILTLVNSFNSYST